MNLRLALSLGTIASQMPSIIPLFADAPPAAISFNQRNGDTAGTGVAARFLSGPALVNVFGDRNNANTAGGRQPGLIAFRAMYLPGNALSSGTTTSGPNQLQQVMGTAFSTSNRSIRCAYAGPINADTAARNKFAFFGRFANAVDFGGTGVPIRTAAIDPFSFEPVMIFLRMNAAGRLQAFHAFADGSLVAGDFFDHAATAGMAATAAACTFGAAGGSGSYQNCFSGSLSDFIQVNNVDVTDAQLSALARGEDPTAVLGAAPFAYYRMAGPTDLALTQGTSGYAALTVVDTNSQLRVGTARPSTAGGRTIQLLPEFDGFVHALHPALVRAAANRAAVKALTANCLMRVRIAGSGSTHVWGRIRRSSDDAILVDWTRLTPSPVSAGVHELELPGAPVGVDFYREVGAEDGLNTSLDRERHRAGIVAMMIGQSQQEIMFVSPATGADTASSNGLVSIIRSYQNTSTVVSAAAARLDRPGLIGGAMYELAKHWQEQADGIPLQMVCLAAGGTSRNDWMNSTGADFWGGTAPADGRVPATVHMARRRFTLFLENWHTSDQGAINAGQLPALNDELYLGIGHSGSRRNFSQFPLVHPVWVAGVPFIRHRVISAGAPSEAFRNSFQTARMIQREYYQGVGGSPSLIRDNAAYMTALAIGPIGEAPHQRTDDVRGNVYFGRWTAMGLARMAKLYSVDIETSFDTVSRSGNVLTLTTNRPNGGSLQTLVDDQTPIGFEVSEDGGTNWSRSDGAIPFTVARVGNTVTLTRASGNWAANTQVRYLFGYPWDIPPGNNATAFANETTAVDQMLCETNANAPLGKVPLRPTITPLVAA